MADVSEIGPVELVVLTFPGTQVDPDTVAAFQDVVAKGYVTLLDLVYLFKDRDRNVTQVDVDENLDEVGLAALDIDAQTLISDADLDVIRESLDPDSSAAIIVYEETWARSIASTVRGRGGEVALHIQIPRDTIAAAIAATT